MFKEGNRECIERLLKPARAVLDTGLSIRNEPYDKRQALWNEIKANAEKFRQGECGKFLSDLNTVFSASFDASLLLLNLSFRQNNEQFEGSGFFSPKEIEAYETIEKFGYFRILSKNEIAKKIRTKDPKTLALLQEYSLTVKPRMDGILSDATIRDSIRIYLKRQWEENTKKVGDAISSAGVDLDWFSSLPAMTKENEKPAQTIIINAGNDAAINLGQGNIVKDAVVTGSTIESAGGGGTTVKDSVVTRSTIESAGTTGGEAGIRISDSVLTSSTIKNVHEAPAVQQKGPDQPPPQHKCLLCGTVVKPGTKFCTSCGAKISATCPGCRAVLLPNTKFCPECGRKTI